jgi:hypothetical protein
MEHYALELVELGHGVARVMPPGRAERTRPPLPSLSTRRTSMSAQISAAQARLAVCAVGRRQESATPSR